MKSGDGHDQKTSEFNQTVQNQNTDLKSGNLWLYGDRCGVFVLIPPGGQKGQTDTDRRHESKTFVCFRCVLV